MSEIHSTAARGFDSGADAYERGRPSYPSAAIDFLLEHIGGRVLDLGAGTGKLTRLLVERGVDCVGVEPVAGMRARAEALDIDIRDGSAEAIPLPDASVDAIVVAQAFHWFDHARALPEMRRVLKPGGRLVLVWNVRDERVAWVKRITDLIAPYEGADGVRIPRHRDRTWLPPLEAARWAQPVERREFEHGHGMDADGLVDRVASTSFIAVLPDDERARVLEQVRALTAEPPLGGQERFVFPYVTEVDVFAAADPGSATGSS